jgi:biopolymer transport protein ExbD
MLYQPRTAVFARRRARVEIIPLIDVIFFLLATFVLFTLSLSALRSLPLDLPFCGSPSDTEPVTIQVSGDNAIFWNGESVAAAELTARLSHYKGHADNPRVLLVSDERARLDLAVGVLDAVRRAGISKFSTETRVRAVGK